MNLQQILSYTRRAVDDYAMIEENDKIAIGISGGKDSLTLLQALHRLSLFYPKKFEITAITVDLGFQNLNLDPIIKLCKEWNIPYTIVKTAIAQIVFQERREGNPCSLCAKMRKGALNQNAKELGCNKIAYAHHKDDVIETLMMSLLYEGRFHTFSPKTYLEQTQLTVIRPLLYLLEADIIGYVRAHPLPVAKSPCPVDGHTKREYVKQLIAQMNRENHGCKERMFTAIVNGQLPGWPERNI